MSEIEWEIYGYKIYWQYGSGRLSDRLFTTEREVFDKRYLELKKNPLVTSIETTTIYQRSRD